MKITKKLFWSKIEDFTQSELELINQKLTFNDSFDKSNYFKYYKDRNAILVLSGLLPILQSAFGDNFELTQVYNDEQFDVPIDIVKLEGMTYWEHQESAIRAILQNSKGIVQVPTRGGKTEIVLGSIANFLQLYPDFTYLIITPTLKIFYQFYNRALLRGFDKNLISLIGDGNKSITDQTKIVIASIDTLYNIVSKRNPDDRIYQYLSNVDCLFVDEVQMISAPSFFHTVLSLKNLKRAYGVSGTPFRSKVLDLNLHPRDAICIGLFEKLIYKVDYDVLKERNQISSGYITMLESPKNTTPYSKWFDWATVYKHEITDNENRNNLIASIAKKFSLLNLKTLILVQRINHGKTLLKLLSNSNIRVAFSSGQGNFDSDLKNYNGNPLEDFINGKLDVLIGSTIFDLGVDVPSTNLIIIAGGGGASYIKNVQRAARTLMLNPESNNRVFCIDFNDIHHPFTKKHSRQRLKDVLDNGWQYVDYNQFLQMVMQVVEFKESYQANFN